MTAHIYSVRVGGKLVTSTTDLQEGCRALEITVQALAVANATGDVTLDKHPIPAPLDILPYRHEPGVETLARYMTEHGSYDLLHSTILFEDGIFKEVEVALAGPKA